MTLEQLVAKYPHATLRMRCVPGAETTQCFEGRTTENAHTFDEYRQNADGRWVRVEQR